MNTDIRRLQKPRFCGVATGAAATGAAGAGATSPSKVSTGRFGIGCTGCTFVTAGAGGMFSWFFVSACSSSLRGEVRW